jgi:RHS repeat-associated protein
MDNYREFTYHAATTHAYDQVGNRTELAYADTSTGSGQVRTTTFAYDGVNRLASVTGWGSQVTYGYDGAGRVRTTTLPNGVVTTRGYDTAGRLTDIVHAGPSWGLAHYHYVLDGLGNRTQAVERVLPPTPVTHLPLVTRNYGDGGEMMSMPEGGLAAPETFQSPLQPVEPVPAPTAAPTPTPSSEGRAPGKARLTGSVSGLAPLRWLGNVVRWLAEGLGKIWRAIFPPGGTAQHAPLTFTSPIGGQGSGDEVTINYTYDKLYRLTDADYTTGQSFDYAYDAAGNRTSYSGPEGTHSYTYDQADRLTQVDGTTYTYDGRGNLTWDGTRSYAWDGAGRLESVTQGGTTTAYTYAGDGVRLTKAVQGQGTTRYVQDPVSPLPNVLAETTGSATTHYFYGLNQLAQVQDGQTQWLLGDGLGSVRQAVNGQGHIVLSRGYSPFGKLLGEDGDVATSYGFAGEQTDPNDLIFLRARYYDVQTGRFISKDPFPGITPFPQSLHPYTYCFNNAVNHTDPSGELPHLVVTTLVGAILGGTIGGISYALRHRGEAFDAQALGRAMLVGVAGGAVAGLIGGAVPMLLPAAANVWGAMGIGALTGSLSAGAGQVTTNVLTPCVKWHHNLGRAMLVGGVAGGVAGGVGYGLRQWGANRINTSRMPVPQLEAPRVQRHHIFPQTFRTWFASKGIDIDRYTIELTQQSHLAGVHGRGGFVGPGNVGFPGRWNALWAAFKSANPNATAKEIYQFAGALMDQFGLSGLPIVHY